MCTVAPENVDRMRALAAAEDLIGIRGYLGTDVMVPENHPGTLLMVVRFDDRDSYVANAESPDQNARYEEFRALMEADPVWYDGEWITSA
jgi:antibiotic biosynthesis monooxygenase (ABM) superfamily enzyme